MCIRGSFWGVTLLCVAGSPPNQDYITPFYWFISSDLDAKDTGLVFAVTNFVSCYVPDLRRLLGRGS